MMKQIALILPLLLTITACQQSEHANIAPKATASATASAPHTGMTHDHSQMHQQAMPVASSPAAASSESVYQVGGNWKDQTGKPFDLNHLAGKKQVTAFIYTSCQAVCPIIMKTMKDIQDKLPAKSKANTEFLVISLDPKRDTPQVLAKFGEHYKVDDKWHFLSASDDDIRMLANTMNIRYQFAEQGEINHSNVISVLDETGKMIEQTIGNSEGEAKIIAAVTTDPTSAK